VVLPSPDAAGEGSNTAILVMAGVAGLLVTAGTSVGTVLLVQRRRTGSPLGRQAQPTSVREPRASAEPACSA
jgi:hypothetical protein